MKVLALYHLKGGVGKTAGAVNLAHLAARRGQRTLLWDLDPQGAATYYFRIRPKAKGSGRKLIRGRLDAEALLRASDYDHLDVLPADFAHRKLERALAEAVDPEERLAEVLDSLSGQYDRVFLDCAPSASVVAENVFRAADALLMPTIPTTLSLRTFARLVRHLRRQGDPPQLLPFLCMVDRRKSMHRAICDWVQENAPGFLSTMIPYSSDVERMGFERRPVTDYALSSAGGAAFADLADEIEERLASDAPRNLFRKRTLRMLDLVGRDGIEESRPSTTSSG